VAALAAHHEKQDVQHECHSLAGAPLAHSASAGKETIMCSVSAASSPAAPPAWPGSASAPPACRQAGRTRTPLSRYRLRHPRNRQHPHRPAVRVRHRHGQPVST
jgi:hypothetical protein